ncbi:MAG: hypothetical protein ACTSQI_03915 [Candidatus Helarchaeota archaeon]
MDSIIFYTDLDKVIGCTRTNKIEGEPFCDACQNHCDICVFRGRGRKDIQQNLQNERHLKATFIKLYLEKTLRIF